MIDQDDTNRILKELENTKKELKNTIEESESRIVSGLNTRIKELEDENISLRKTVENLQINSKKNNILVFGLEKNLIKEIPKLCQSLSKVLKISFTEKDLSDTYCMGDSDNCPIKLELVTHFKKIEILRNGRNLKGTGVYISSDLTKNQQLELAILKKHLKIVRQTEPNKNSYIRGSKLYIDYKGYTSKELEEGAYVIKPKRLTNSAPTTPTFNRPQEDEVFFDTETEKLKQKEITDVTNESLLEQKDKEKYNKEKEKQQKPLKEVENKQTPKRPSSASTGGKPQILKTTRITSSSTSSENKIKTRSNKNQ